jgi:hypothetical protein
MLASNCSGEHEELSTMVFAWLCRASWLIFRLRVMALSLDSRRL